MDTSLYKNYLYLYLYSDIPAIRMTAGAVLTLTYSVLYPSPTSYFTSYIRTLHPVYTKRPPALYSIGLLTSHLVSQPANTSTILCIATRDTSLEPEHSGHQGSCGACARLRQIRQYTRYTKIISRIAKTNPSGMGTTSFSKHNIYSVA